MKKALLAVTLLSLISTLAFSQKPALRYPEFKQRFQVGTLQFRVTFTLADSLIQEGKLASSMQVFFTSDTDMMLMMNPQSREIRDITITVSGPKTNGKFNDLGYALAIIWALENTQSTSEASVFLKSVLDLPVGKRFVSKVSGFRYSHGLQTDSTISVSVQNPRLVD